MPIARPPILPEAPEDEEAPQRKAIELRIAKLTLGQTLRLPPWESRLLHLDIEQGEEVEVKMGDEGPLFSVLQGPPAPPIPGVSAPPPMDALAERESLIRQQNTLLEALFPKFKAEDILTFAKEQTQEFLGEIQKKGKSVYTEAILRGFFGATEEEIKEFFPFQRVEVPIDGIPKQVNVTGEGYAFDDKGKRVGTYNTITREFTSLPKERIVKDFWDALRFGTRGAWQQTKEFVVSALPQFLFAESSPQEKKLYGDTDWLKQRDAANRERRDKFREIYAREQESFETWRGKHPELERPERWGWVMDVVGSAPASIAAMGATMAGAVVGQPVLGVAAGLAIMTPMQTQDVYESLLAAGVSEEEAARWALPVGGLISGIETVADMPYLKSLAPAIHRKFIKGVTNEVAKEVRKSMVKKGLKTFSQIELTETLEEVAQQAIQNTAVWMFDKNQSLIEGFGRSAVGAALMVVPLSFIGGGVSMRRVPPHLTRGLTEVELTAKGWFQDPESPGNWYAPIAGGAEEVLPEELPPTLAKAGVPAVEIGVGDVVTMRGARAEDAVKIIGETTTPNGRPAWITQEVSGPTGETGIILKEDATLISEAPAEVTPIPTEKPFWRMTQNEVLEEARESSLRMGHPISQVTIDSFKAQHKAFVKDAINRGKPVPPEVLAEYPDLAAQAGKVAPTELRAAIKVGDTVTDAWGNSWKVVKIDGSLLEIQSPETGRHTRMEKAAVQAINGRNVFEQAPRVEPVAPGVEKATGPARVRYDKGSQASAIDAALRLKSDQVLFIYPTNEGFQIGRSVFPRTNHIRVTPSGRVMQYIYNPQKATYELKELPGPRFGKPVTPEVTPSVAPEAAPPAPPVEVTPPVTPQVGQEITPEQMEAATTLRKAVGLEGPPPGLVAKKAAPPVAPGVAPEAVSPPVPTTPTPPVARPVEPAPALPVPARAPEAPPGSPQEATQRVEAIHTQGRLIPESVSPQDAETAHIEGGAPDGPRQPPPPRGPRGRGVPPPREPADVVREIAAKATPGERADQTLLRLHEGAISAEQTRVGVIIRDGNQQLKTAGIGAVRRGQLIPRAQDIPRLNELYNALHNPSKVASGEVQVPQGFEAIYRELRDRTDWMTSAMLDFDPNAATIEDYFYRGWKPPVPQGGIAGVGQGRPLVRVPAFKKPRADATYQEMREAGFEPLFWNPYQQWGVRQMMGTKYREQMELVAHLKGMGDELIRPHAGGPIPQGWRVPEVGPAFEGKPFATTDATGEPATMFTRRWIVPDKVANTLESIYGKRPTLGKVAIGGRAVDPLAVIDWLTFMPKRAKLFGSFFQQIDFLGRAGQGSLTMMVDSLQAGKPIQGVIALAKYPDTVVTILRANLSPSFRQSLARQLDSTEPLLTDRPGVHFRGIVEAGLSTIDPTMLQWAEMDKMVRDVVTEVGLAGSALRQFGEVESAMRRGLFQGVYPAALTTDIQNNIAPIVARMYPTLNDAQLNGMIARIANKKYSTIPASQSVIQNRVLRESLKRVVFSMGESEGLLRQAGGAISGPEAAYWRTHWVGTYLFLIAVASVIHWASTGEPLPKERYIPVAKTKWGPLPFGYNTQFAAPTLPFRGRGGAELTLDVVGQMDTAFRILNPQFFVESRTSVPIRAGGNQISGTDFFGRPIDEVGPGGVVSRTAQLAQDLFGPIGLGGLAGEMARRTIPGGKEAIAEAEARLGLVGLGVQATGVNVRAANREQRLRSVHGPEVQKTLDLLDKLGLPLAYVSRRFDTTLGKKGGEITLTPEQREQLQWMTDDAVVKGIGPLITNPVFQGWSDEEQKEFVAKESAKLRAKARAEFRDTLKGVKKPTTTPKPTPQAPPPTPTPTAEEERKAKVKDLQAKLTKMEQAISPSVPEMEATARRIEAYQQGLPEDLHDAHVEYYKLPTKGYARERFLQENKDYYERGWRGIFKNKPIDFDKIPSKAVEASYERYKKLPIGTARLQARAADPDLDAWGIKVGKWKKLQPTPTPESTPESTPEPTALFEGTDGEKWIEGAQGNKHREALWERAKKQLGDQWLGEWLATRDLNLTLEPKRLSEDEFAGLKDLLDSGISYAEWKTDRALGEAQAKGLYEDMANRVFDDALSYGKDFLRNLGIDPEGDPTQLSEADIAMLIGKMQEELKKEAIRFAEKTVQGTRNQWLEEWNVPKAEWKDWQEHVVEIFRTRDWGAAYFATPGKKGKIGITPSLLYNPITMAHEFAHANHFEQLPAGMKRIYPLVQRAAIAILPAYKKVLSEYPGGKGLLPVEGYAEAYAKLGKGKERLPWFLEPFYGNLLFEVPDLPGPMEKTALAWLASWMAYKVKEIIRKKK